MGNSNVSWSPILLRHSAGEDGHMPRCTSSGLTSRPEAGALPGALAVRGEEPGGAPRARRSPSATGHGVMRRLGYAVTAPGLHAL